MSTCSQRGAAPASAHRRMVVALTLSTLVASPPAGSGATTDVRAPAPPLTHTGMCDASAAIALGRDRFLVASDEDSVLRTYDATRSGPPLSSFDLTRFLLVDHDHPEADLEGAARLGDRVYWIGSHGRNRDGKQRPNRHVFFATTVAEEGDRTEVKPVGKPFTRMVELMLADAGLRDLGLHDAVGPGTREDAALAPKKAGLNIESLAAARDGRGLLIGLRNPRPRGDALVVPLLNPAEVVDGEADPRFGSPMLLSLDGRGVRAMAWSPAIDAYLLVAGPGDGSKDFELLRWAGRGDDQPTRITTIDQPQLTPEAIVGFGDDPNVVLLGDGGSVEIDGRDCKDLDDRAKQRFLSIRTDVRP